MRLRDALDGKRLLLTGVTGFVGQALLARVLTDLPGTTVVLLVRAKGSATGADRVRTLLGQPVFDALRATGADMAALAAARVEVVEGDVTDPPPLPGDLDVVIHCAGDVSFDPPIQQAFATNVHGARRLLDRIAEAATPRAGRGPLPHYVHISTAYVAGRRRGAIPEAPVEHDVDWRTEAAAADAVHDRIGEQSRTPEVLAGLRADAERAHRKAGPLTGAADTERRRIGWVQARLVDAGRERARSLGWTDCYTFTKAMAERVVEEYAATRGFGVSIVRPSIIESALASPTPGWIEGFKMAEPIILAYGRGDLPEFPAAPDAVVDIVPVDHVVAATLAVAATAVTAAAADPDNPPAPRWFHVSSGARNPLTFRRVYELVREYFDAHPLVVSDRGAAPLAQWRFPGSDAVERLLVTGERAAGVADAVLTHVPRSDAVRRLTVGLDTQRRRLAFLRRYLDLYRAYTESELQFIDDATLALSTALDPADVPGWAFDTAEIDWTGYIRDLHCPAVTMPLRAAAAVRGRRQSRTARVARPLTAADDVAAVFDMDGTVVAANVVQTYLWLRLPELTPAGRVREIAGLAGRLPGWLRAERRDRGAFLRAVYRRYAGADPTAIDELVDETVSAHLLARASSDALRRVREHRAAGHRTILVTGSIRPLTRPFASLFDVVMAADLAVGPDGLVAGSLTGPPLVGEARGAWLRRYADREGLDLARSYAYADSHSDAALLESVGNPVAVRPDVALFRLARARQWPVVDWSAPGALTAAERSTA